MNKLFEDIFLPLQVRENNMLLEGIHTEKLCKIRSNAGDKETWILESAPQVVKGSDASKLVYKLTNIQMEYENTRSKTLADEAPSVYYNGKAFAFDHIVREEVVTSAKATDSRLNIKYTQGRSLKGILLLFIESYTAGTRNLEKYFNPDITKVSVTVNGLPNKIYAYVTPSRCRI